LARVEDLDRKKQADIQQYIQFYPNAPTAQDKSLPAPILFSGLLFVYLRVAKRQKMSKIVKKDYFTKEQEQTARFAKALGHPMRLAILELLNSQACCYHGDMAEELPIAKSTLSQHLKELKDAGLIQGDIVPPNVRYCINRENFKLAKSLLNKVFE
jgi:DNA-binding transcriptional ArsR family regulator